MKHFFKNILLSIEKEESKLSVSKQNLIEEAHHMVGFLHNLLTDLKKQITLSGFDNTLDEVIFFKTIKPQILGKLIFYNKIIRIESFSPSNFDLREQYFSNQIKELNKEFKKHIGSSEFYKYYRSGRTDQDNYYYRLGNINFFEGLNSFIFEADFEFSTYYDFKIARIVAFDLLHTYLKLKLIPKQNSDFSYPIVGNSKFSWTDSKNALIELIYALHISGSVSNGRAGLKRISKLFEELFEVNLGDIHHAFHQMKYRAGEKASYLHHLKNSLEQYMERDL